MSEINLNDITGKEAFEVLFTLGNKGREEQTALMSLTGLAEMFLKSQQDYFDSRSMAPTWHDESAEKFNMAEPDNSHLRLSQLFAGHYNLVLPTLVDDESNGVELSEMFPGEFSMSTHPVTGAKVQIVGDLGVVAHFPAGFCGNNNGFSVYCGDLTNNDVQYIVNYDSEVDALGALADAFEKAIVNPNIYEGQILGVSGGCLSVLPKQDLSHVRISDSVEKEISEFVSVIGSRNSLLKKAGLATKRGMLFAGPPGTGKTVTAAVIAQRVLDEGGTVLYPEAGEHVAGIMDMARLFSKALVVFEDVESFAGTRGMSNFSTFLNALDGVDDREDILTLSTTNNSEGLDKAVLRAGRTDQYVTFGWFTEEQVATVLRGSLSDVYDLDWDAIAAAIRGVEGKTTGAEIASLSTALILRFGEDVSTEEVITYVRESWTSKVTGENFLN